MIPHRPGRGPRGTRTRTLLAALTLAVPATLTPVASAAVSATTLVSAAAVNGNGPYDASFQQASADGSHVFLVTEEQLVGADTDAAFDVYERAGGATALVSTGPVNGNGPFEASFLVASTDGARVLVQTSEPLVSSDTDASSDVYERSGGVTTLVSRGLINGNGPLDASFIGASADASRVFFETSEPLVAADTDGAVDVYEREGGATTLVSTGPGTGNGPADASYVGASTDGALVFFHTTEQLVPADTDGAVDVYQRSGGATTLVSTGPVNGNGSPNAAFAGASADGSRVFFLTAEALVGADTDGAFDVYQRSGGTTSLVSTGPINGNGDTSAFLVGTSTDGSRVFFATSEQLVAADTDGAVDVYERAGGATALVSLGAVNGNGPFGASYAGVSADGSRVFFQTAEPLVGDDTDAAVDLYERSAGTTTLVSRGAVNGNGPQDASFAGAALDGSHVYFQTAEPLVGADTDAAVDLYERSAGTTTLVSRGAVNGNGPLDAYYAGASADGSHVFFQTAESLVGADADTSSDVYLAELAADSPVSPATIALAPATPNGSNGWYRSVVHVTARSGSAAAVPVRCALDPSPPPASFAALPAGCPYAGKGADVAADGEHAVWAAADEREAPVGAPFKIDRTAPRVTCAATPTLPAGRAATVTANVADSVSGPSNSVVSAPADVSSPGAKSVSLTGQDRAGNATTVHCPYVVSGKPEYRFVGLWPADGSRHRAGWPILVVFKLAGPSGRPIPDAEARGLARACAVRVASSADGAGERSRDPGCARYESWRNVFVAWVPTSRHFVGRQTITVTISPPGKPLLTATINVIVKH